MRLAKVEIRNFRNIVDSGEVDIEPKVTCFVGKNESGKTAFLQALCRLHPARSNVAFSVPDHYPAWLEKKHRQEGKDLDAFKPVNVTFEYEQSEVAALEERFGKGVLKNTAKLVASRAYSGALTYAIEVSEAAFTSHVISNIDWAHGTKGVRHRLHPGSPDRSCPRPNGRYTAGPVHRSGNHVEVPAAALTSSRSAPRTANR